MTILMTTARMALGGLLVLLPMPARDPSARRDHPRPGGLGVAKREAAMAIATGCCSSPPFARRPHPGSPNLRGDVR
jgi:hypothetical protein